MDLDWKEWDFAMGISEVNGISLIQFLEVNMGLDQEGCDFI